MRGFLLVLGGGVLLASVASAARSRVSTPAYEAQQVKNTILRVAANPIQECFKKWEKKNASFKEGKVHVDWEIQPNGKVKNAQIIHSDLKGMEPCVVAAVEKAVFPPPPDHKPYYVAHKFHFKDTK